jgi:hypothetical protein
MPFIWTSLDGELLVYIPWENKTGNCFENFYHLAIEVPFLGENI